jgi:N-acetylmuramoyl-L-alanine amidase
MSMVLLAGFLVIERAPDTVAAVSTPSPLVVIDPGHGGWDPGAVRGAVYEKSLTLAVASKLGMFLQQHGIRVYYTRSRDMALASTVFSDLSQRASLANRLGATVLVSIHVNTESTGTMAGPIVYFTQSTASSYPLALAINRHLAGLAARQHSPRPIRQWVLLASHMPAVNVEIGFLSHSADAARLQAPWYQTRLAARIAEGITSYLGYH